MQNNNMPAKPQVAIVTEDVFSAVGLKHLLEELIPFAQIDLIHSIEDAKMASRLHKYFHYFISVEIWAQHAHTLEHLKRHAIVYGKTDKRISVSPDIHFIASDQTPQEVTMALIRLQDTAHHQYRHYPADISQKLISENQQQDDSLTGREIEIIKLMAIGKSSKELARQLHISLSTVYTHRQHIMEKLNAHSATKVIHFALNQGYISINEIHKPFK